MHWHSNPDDKRKRQFGDLWPLVINLWLGAVIALFFVLRVIGSGSFRNFLERWRAR